MDKPHQPINALRDLLSEAADVFRDLQEALEAGLLSEQDRIDMDRYAGEIRAYTEALTPGKLDA